MYNKTGRFDSQREGVRGGMPEKRVVYRRVGEPIIVENRRKVSPVGREPYEWHYQPGRPKHA